MGLNHFTDNAGDFVSVKSGKGFYFLEFRIKDPRLGQESWSLHKVDVHGNPENGELAH